jgi:hypothetical protein
MRYMAAARVDQGRLGRGHCVQALPMDIVRLRLADCTPAEEHPAR